DRSRPDYAASGAQPLRHPGRRQNRTRCGGEGSSPIYFHHAVQRVGDLHAAADRAFHSAGALLILLNKGLRHPYIPPTSFRSGAFYRIPLAFLTTHSPRTYHEMVTSIMCCLPQCSIVSLKLMVQAEPETL